MWPHQSSSRLGTGCERGRSAPPGEGVCPEDHVTWRPRPCPGRKHGPGATRASHTFHNKLTHGKDPAARPSNQGKQTRTNQHHGNADGTGQSERTCQLLPGTASRGSACVRTAAEHRVRTGPPSSRQAARASGRSPHQGKEPPLPPQPAWRGPSTQPWSVQRIVSPRKIHGLVNTVRPRHIHSTDTEQNPTCYQKGRRQKEEAGAELF